MRTKELVVCLLTLFVLALTISNVYAQGPGNDNNVLNNITNIPVDNNYTTNQNSNNNYTTNTNVNTNQNLINVTPQNNVNNNINVTSNTNTGKDLPEAGVDYSIVLIIAICGVSAAYAYKKIRDYKI